MTYRIKTVSRLTGIAADTIRAWERRHKVVSPQRSASGQRIYSEADVAVLHRVKAMLDTGLSIGEVSQVLQGEAKASVVTDPPVVDGGANASSPFGAVVDELTGAFVALDRDAAERVLRPLLPLYPFEVTFEQIFTPALVSLGERWRRGEGSVAAEHFAAAFVREKLIAMLSAVTAPGAGRPRALLACPEGERHELGLLYLALRLSARGWETVYLGPDMPVDGIVAAMGQVSPGIVGVSLTQHQDKARRLSEVGRICGVAGRETLVMVGGGAGQIWRAEIEGCGAHVISSEEDFNTVIRGQRRNVPKT